ncbi:hypothetical protein BC937DRAFT_92640 [Endogone sp. FLAS-F59071]|nr:hypothetical protein BC937DRAFT_92640 [Endogone sp. FLAS-F59071]|eukprot:RUS15292.1 hypothetical protein BC937DRAFT_92640 [Endogone sp. FLAS-F59071]
MLSPSPTSRRPDLDNILPAARKILHEFRECMTKWDEINNKGTEILRLLAADRDDYPDYDIVAYQGAIT